jgi:hypothetical protein
MIRGGEMRRRANRHVPAAPQTTALTIADSVLACVACVMLSL